MPSRAVNPLSLRNGKMVILAELIDDMLVFVDHHKDKLNYESKAVNE